MCQTCGVIGCCDSSTNRHASRHAREAGHPVLRSVEPGERWSWCVIDEVAFVLDAG
jgi:CPA1 family monovalent cation:H+ antiporter